MSHSLDFRRWRHNRLLITPQWPDNCDAVRFCWVPSHCGIEGNEIVDQLAKETLDHDIDPLTTVHYADLKPLVNSYIQGPPETNTRTTQGISAPDQRWGGCDNPTPNWPYQGHKIPYLVPRTTNCLPELRTYSWNVQCCNKVVISTTQLTHWEPSLRRSQRLA